MPETPVKFRIKINEKCREEGYYTSYFVGKTLIAEKTLTAWASSLTPDMLEHFKESLSSVSTYESMLYRWSIKFADNPEVWPLLKAKKAKGLDDKWKGIDCELHMADVVGGSVPKPKDEAEEEMITVNVTRAGAKLVFADTKQEYLVFPGYRDQGMGHVYAGMIVRPTRLGDVARGFDGDGDTIVQSWPQELQRFLAWRHGKKKAAIGVYGASYTQALVTAGEVFHCPTSAVQMEQVNK